MVTLSDQEIIDIDPDDPVLLKADKRSAELVAEQYLKQNQQLIAKDKQSQVSINKLNHKIQQLEYKYNQQLNKNQHLQQINDDLQQQLQLLSPKRNRNNNISIASKTQTQSMSEPPQKRQKVYNNKFENKKQSERWHCNDIESSERDEWKLNPIKLKEGINTICDLLGIYDKSKRNDMIPTIDCFSNEYNQQKICWEQITKQENYFSKRYDDKEFWSFQTAWCNPPFGRTFLEECVESFKKREMKGYICGPYYPHGHQKFKHQKWYINAVNLMNANKNRCVKVNIGGLNDKNMYFSGKTGYKYGTTRTPFQTVIFYFNLQD